MAVLSGMFNSKNGDRRYDASWFALFFSNFVNNGVWIEPTTNLQVFSDENLRIKVREGRGWINGYFVINDSDLYLNLDVADGVLKRIDRVVMGLDLTSRTIDIYVKKGTNSSTPVAPALTRDSMKHELSLCDVLVDAGATQILQGNITDNRFNSALCGIVTGFNGNITTTELFAQFTNEFDRWFADLQAQLSGDVAANLQNQITQHNNSATPHLMTDDVTQVSYKYGIGISNGEFYIAREEV